VTTIAHDGPDETALLTGAGLAADEVAAWQASRSSASADLDRDAAHFSRSWKLGSALCRALPPKPRRNAAEAAAAAHILGRDRKSRDLFMAAHVDAVYRRLTDDRTRFVRVEQLVADAARLVPGLTPSPADLAREVDLMQRDKDGVEVDQGIFLSQVLGHAASGAHLCHTMLLPRRGATEQFPDFAKRGRLDLGAALVERRGRATFVVMRNPRFLNAEDEGTIDAVETAVDLAILDPESDMCVLQGDTVEHPKWQGRRVFSAGINLTHIYHGKISYLWYIKRELGFVNKMLRGVAYPDISPDEVCGDLREKPWLAAVDSFAIGGGCQYLLAMDYVVAASDAYMTLPARKEGIIPGCANLRLWRFTGDRIARQAILYGRRLDCDSPEGRLICDEVVPPGELDTAVARVVDGFTSSGVVSAAGNRRAIRVGQEPLDLFRRYMAVYAREQAICHFSPALIDNLEKHWNAQQRRA
jgi:thioesterase DpgC